MSTDHLAASNGRPVHFPYPEASRQSRPLVAFPVCVSMHTPLHNSAGDPAAARRFTRLSAHNVDQLSSGVRRGRAAIPACCLGADQPLCFPCCAPLCSSLPGRFVTFWACHRLLCQSIDGVPASAGNSNSDHVGKKVRTLAKSRVSIKTRELRLSTRECNFPGINIPNYNTSIFCFLNYYWILFTIADKTNYKLFQEEGIHQMV